jgi:hypothetical protein
MEVRPLSDAPSETPKTLHIRIPFASLTPTRLEHFKALVLAHPGGCHVKLHIANGKSGETVIALSDQYGVDPSSGFQTMLKHLFESSNLSFD